MLIFKQTVTIYENIAQNKVNLLHHTDLLMNDSLINPTLTAFYLNEKRLRFIIEKVTI